MVQEFRYFREILTRGTEAPADAVVAGDGDGAVLVTVIAGNAGAGAGAFLAIVMTGVVGLGATACPAVAFAEFAGAFAACQCKIIMLILTSGSLPKLLGLP